MAKKETLEKIDNDLRMGCKQKAIFRLRSLVAAYPYDLSLRDQLATIYDEAGFLDMAGLYWLLRKPDNAHMENAIAVYKASVNYSQQQMLRDMAFHGDSKQLDDYAQKVIDELSDSTKVVKKKVDSSTNETWAEKYGCLAALFFALTLLIWGAIDFVMTLLPWLFNTLMA